VLIRTARACWGSSTSGFPALEELVGIRSSREQRLQAVTRLASLHLHPFRKVRRPATAFMRFFPRRVCCSTCVLIATRSQRQSSSPLCTLTTRSHTEMPVSNTDSGCATQSLSERTLARSGTGFPAAAFLWFAQLDASAAALRAYFKASFSGTIVTWTEVSRDSLS